MSRLPGKPYRTCTHNVRQLPPAGGPHNDAVHGLYSTGAALQNRDLAYRSEMACRVLDEHRRVPTGASGRLLAGVDERRFQPGVPCLGGEAAARRHAGGAQLGNRQPPLYEISIISAEPVRAVAWAY